MNKQRGDLVGPLELKLFQTRSLVFDCGLMSLSLGYAEEEKKFWISIHSTSLACFERLSCIFNGPCIRSVIAWTEPVKEELRQELFDMNLVSKIASRWAKIWGGVDDLFTLSYDAYKIDDDLMISEAGVVTGVMRAITLDESPLSYRTNPDLYRKLWEKQIETRNLQTHAFVFILTPVSESRGYPIHIGYENTGSATPEVLPCIREIAESKLSSGWLLPPVTAITSIGCNSTSILTISTSSFRGFTHGIASQVIFSALKSYKYQW